MGVSARGRLSATYRTTEPRRAWPDNTESSSNDASPFILKLEPMEAPNSSIEPSKSILRDEPYAAFAPQAPPCDLPQLGQNQPPSTFTPQAHSYDLLGAKPTQAPAVVTAQYLSHSFLSLASRQSPALIASQAPSYYFHKPVPKQPPEWAFVDPFTASTPTQLIHRITRQPISFGQFLRSFLAELRARALQSKLKNGLTPEAVEAEATREAKEFEKGGKKIEIPEFSDVLFMAKAHYAVKKEDAEEEWFRSKQAFVDERPKGVMKGVMITCDGLDSVMK